MDYIPAAVSRLPAEAARDAMQQVTRGEVDAAFDRAMHVAARLARKDDAIDLIARTAGNPPGDGPFTVREVLVAWNVIMEWAKDQPSSKDEENDRTIRSDSCGSLIANLAIGFLRTPDSDIDAVIADQRPAAPRGHPHALGLPLPGGRAGDPGDRHL